jgi:hypothetical protein
VTAFTAATPFTPVPSFTCTATIDKNIQCISTNPSL